MSLSLLVLVGCAGGRKEAEEPKVMPIAVPAELREDVRRAEVLGQALFRVDALAWQATDLALAAGLGPKLGGWVVDESEAEPAVVFLARGVEPPAANARVVFRAGAPALEELDPAVPLEGALLARHAASVTASSQPVPVCKQPYNQAVVPAEAVGERGWFVWLLAATTKPDEVVLGIHHRFHVSEDGAKVLAHQQMTKSCLTLKQEKPAPGEELAGMFVTHLTSPTPTETHVFASLGKRVPLYVGTTQNRLLWKVDGRTLSAMQVSEED